MAKTSSHSKTIDPLKLRTEYDSVFPFAQSLRDEVVRQAEKLLDANSIALGFPIQSRIKEFDSLLSKYENIATEFENVKDVQDIVGLRVILQFKRDVARVVDILLLAFSLVRHAKAFGRRSIWVFFNSPSCKDST